MAKEYDAEIKKMFGDYLKAKSRIKMIDLNVAWGENKPEQQEEKKRLLCFIDTVDTMLEQLTPLQKQLVEYYYIYQESLYDISEIVHFSYYHCSNTKNEAVDRLVEIFNSTEFDSIVGKSFNRIYNDLEKAQ